MFKCFKVWKIGTTVCKSKQHHGWKREYFPKRKNGTKKSSRSTYGHCRTKQTHSTSSDRSQQAAREPTEDSRRNTSN